MTKLSFVLLSFILSISLNVRAESVYHSIGQVYCVATHPAEFISPVRHSTCEKQHVLQQNAGGGNIGNTVWWSASSHVRTDVWNDKPWENNRPWFVFGFSDDADVNLEKAYMMGTFGLSWSFFQHDYNGGDSHLIVTEFDAISNLLYAFSWVINIPQKLLNKLAYIYDKGHWHLIVDWLLSLPVLLFEACLAMIVTMIGLVVGFVMNPLDTLLAIPGGLWLGVETTIAAIGQFVAGIWRLGSSGVAGFITAVFIGLSLGGGAAASKR